MTETETDPLPADAVARLRAGLEDHARGAPLRPLPPARVDSEALTACRLEAALEVVRLGWTTEENEVINAAEAYLKDQFRTDGMCQFLPPGAQAAPAEALALLADIRDTLRRVNGPREPVRVSVPPPEVADILAANTRLARERDIAVAEAEVLRHKAGGLERELARVKGRLSPLPPDTHGG